MTALDRNRCDHFYHNGQQVRFLRQQPDTVNGGWELEGWFARLIERFWRAH